MMIFAKYYINYQNKIIIMYILMLFTFIIYILQKWVFKKTPTKLDKQSIVVLTGGCMGIGKQTALILAKSYKSKLVIIDLRKQLFQSCAKLIQQAGGSSQFYQCDLSNHQKVQEVFTVIKGKYPSINVLVNNAGIHVPKTFHDITYNQNKKIMQVNYFAPVQIFNMLLDNLKGGHVVTICSVASFHRGTNMSAYIASKHAIYGYMNSVRVEMIAKNIPITSSLVCPYAINTTMFDGFKTRLQILVPVLDQGYVAQQIVKTIINKDEVVVVTKYVDIVLKILRFFPESIGDRLMIWLDQSNYSKLLTKKSS